MLPRQAPPERRALYMNAVKNLDMSSSTPSHPAAFGPAFRSFPNARQVHIDDLMVNKTGENAYELHSRKQVSLRADGTFPELSLKPSGVPADWRVTVRWTVMLGDRSVPASFARLAEGALPAFLEHDLYMLMLSPAHPLNVWTRLLTKRRVCKPDLRMYMFSYADAITLDEFGKLAEALGDCVDVVEVSIKHATVAEILASEHWAHLSKLRSAALRVSLPDDMDPADAHDSDVFVGCCPVGLQERTHVNAPPAPNGKPAPPLWRDLVLVLDMDVPGNIMPQEMYILPRLPDAKVLGAAMATSYPHVAVEVVFQMDTYVNVEPMARRMARQLEQARDEALDQRRGPVGWKQA
jgi:hypothetical protein